MVTQRRKKVQKYRAHTTHGGGHRKKRRGAGSRGGRGNAGSGKRAGHKRIGKILGKFGFTPRGRKLNNNPSLNVGYFTLEKLNSLEKSGKVKKDGDVYLLDLNILKITKLLGSGKIQAKLNVVGVCTERAAAKIKEAGGSVGSEPELADN